MPTWLKVTLMLVVLSMALLIATIFVGYRAMQRLTDDAQTITADASRFAQGKEAPACVNEAVARAVSCAKGDALCLMRAQMFLMNCVDHARMPPNYCASIPARNTFQIRNRW